VFSYSHSQLDAVIRYIQNQQEHHRRTTFQEEYLEFLKRFNVPHEERYTFQPVQPDQMPLLTELAAFLGNDSYKDFAHSEAARVFWARCYKDYAPTELWHDF
jgi:hypothetical protein